MPTQTDAEPALEDLTETLLPLTPEDEEDPGRVLSGQSLERFAARLMRRSHLLGDFLMVAAEGGIRQAAEKVSISQSAMTRRIQDLESGLGVTLFERTSRGMTLTPFGEVLHHHARQVALTCKYAVSEIGDLLEGEAGELRLSAGPAWAYSLVPDAIAAMHTRHPHISIQLLDLRIDAALPLLAQGSLDVVLGRLPPVALRDPQFVYERLLEIEHLVFANRQHPLSGRSALRPEDLIAYPWIWFTQELASQTLLASYFADAGLKPPSSAVEASSVQSVFRLMQQGNYLMLLPSTSSAMAAHQGIEALSLHKSLGRFDAGMIYRPSVRRLRAFTSFRDVLHEKLPASTLKQPGQ